MSADLQEHYDKIYRYCYFKVGNATLAEDLTQETFLKYFSQNSYIEHGKKLAYLYVIARNLCIDTFQKKQFEELKEDVATVEPFERVELGIAIRQVLKKLPEQEQELLLLRFVNGLAVGEITAITGLSRFAVYRKTSSALSTLKRLMKEDDFS
ncbi:RNA polymerase sigma factor [Fusibacter paucivorans]|uniref:RNA polymerase sigma factor n=1 Tax=Fusibacter paucivorans TaxID=76009 RepID=A0ABS5PLN4_9FIRM|nr:RNA polymerase sigma factor [Fusibacter paucivorans]MBS7525963.1 RNA polymerase sigma factor [Fusibacter paucivorans]